MPALEPLVGLRVVADPAALDARDWQRRRRRHRPAPRAGRRLRDRGRRASTWTTSTRSSSDEARLRRARGCAELDATSPPHIEWALPTRAPGPRPGRRSPACRPSSGCTDDGDGRLARAGHAGGLRATSSRRPRCHERVHVETLPADPLGGRARSRPTTSSSSAAAGTACRPPTTSRPATASRTWPSSRPTTSRRATPAGTRRSSAPTTASPRRSASTSTRSRCTRRSRTRPARPSSTRPRASSGWPTRRWRCARSGRAAS